MSDRKIIKRIVSCQGSIQLVAALSVLKYREKEQQNLNPEYEDYLVIYDLSAPLGQIDNFAILIKKMAELAHQWKSVTYISAEQMSGIFNRLMSANSSQAFHTVHQLVGTEDADEIYLATNWQQGNKLLLNSYRSAYKICCGDSIGIYIPSTLKTITSLTSKSNSLIFKLKNTIRPIIIRIKETFQLRIYLRTIEFDIGYFLLPDILEKSPPMKTVVLEKAWILEIFQKLTGLLEQNYILKLRESIADRPISILLTSNFSEAGRMSQENEITAYRRFLLAEGVEKNTVLVLKPHPRDDSAKIEKLKQTLSDLFSKIFVLSDHNLFFIPFEIFFMEAFWQQYLENNSKNRIFTFSSACFSLKFLFDTNSTIGFGRKITCELFNKDCAPLRIMHEQELALGMEKINS